MRLLLPKGASEATDCVVHLAGTGDHGFERRTHLGLPLIAKVFTHFDLSHLHLCTLPLHCGSCTSGNMDRACCNQHKLNLQAHMRAPADSVFDLLLCRGNWAMAWPL